MRPAFVWSDLHRASTGPAILWPAVSATREKLAGGSMRGTYELQVPAARGVLVLALQESLSEGQVVRVHLIGMDGRRSPVCTLAPRALRDLRQACDQLARKADR